MARRNTAVSPAFSRLLIMPAPRPRKEAIKTTLAKNPTTWTTLGIQRMRIRSINRARTLAVNSGTREDLMGLGCVASTASAVAVQARVSVIHLPCSPIIGALSGFTRDLRALSSLLTGNLCRHPGRETDGLPVHTRSAYFHCRRRGITIGTAPLAN